MNRFIFARREVLKKAGLAGIGTLASGLIFGASAKASAESKTPAQPVGPFYPMTDQLDKDADMTQVQGHNQKASGQRIKLNGQVVDVATGKAVGGAVVEFWQACESGKYNHKDDPNNAALDPHFQYWAQVQTDQDGRFELLTIKPGAYPADDKWTRPPHIHVKVHKQGYPSLTTQMYFASDPLNTSDLILQQLSPSLRAMLVVDFKEDPSKDFWEGSWTIFIAPFVSGRLFHESQNELTKTPDLN